MLRRTYLTTLLPHRQLALLRARLPAHAVPTPNSSCRLSGSPAQKWEDTFAQLELQIMTKNVVLSELSQDEGLGLWARNQRVPNRRPDELRCERLNKLALCAATTYPQNIVVVQTLMFALLMLEGSILSGCSVAPRP